MYINHVVVYINPVLIFLDKDKFEVLDDGMSFSNTIF
jgi:hypothetical protein